MDVKDVAMEEKELLELTDAELESTNGGWSYSPFAYGSFNGSNFSASSNLQTAYANSLLGNDKASFLNLGSINFSSVAQATNYYNFSVGNVSGH